MAGEQQGMDRLLELWRRYADLSRAGALLGWDQETMMPPAGAEGRGRVRAALSGVAHDLLADPALGEVLDRLGENQDQLDPLERAQYREARRHHDKATLIPRRLVEETAAATAAGLQAWKEAREEKDFTRFEPHLDRIVALRREEAGCLRQEEGQELYDLMLDDFEPGLTADRVEELFAGLREPLARLVRQVAESGRTLDTSPLQGKAPRERQLAFCREVVETMGFDLQAGRIDLSAHPFCSSSGPGDVRLTWRSREDDIRPGLYGLIHEAGHGLYEQGLDPELDCTPAGGAVSLGVHESQSRLWENLVGRSLAFWQAFAPSLADRLPDLEGSGHPEALFLAANEVKPSPIRIEADQVTYNLHIDLRFTLERKLAAGKIEAADLPQAWNEAMEEKLGLRPADDAQGVLQDMHWAMGCLGYFPTYTLGNIYASHLFQAAGQDLGDLDELIASRDWQPLREWLGAKVHRHASILPAAELVEQATGSRPDAKALLAYLHKRVELVYQV